MAVQISGLLFFYHLLMFNTFHATKGLQTGMKLLDYKIEKKKLSQGFTLVVGCDEVGRGPLAGPVVACAVVLDAEHIKLIKTNKFGANFYAEINDSKKLSSVKRFQLEKLLKKYALGFGIGVVNPAQIDKLNIHVASLLAMKRAVKSLVKSLNKTKSKSLGNKFHSEKVCVLVDGKFFIPKLDFDGNKKVAQETFVGGDGLVLSIAAASVLAKTYRDRLMEKLNKKFPEYGFEQHKGYGTSKHREAIVKHGLIERVHRKSYIHFV